MPKDSDRSSFTPDFYGISPGREIILHSRLSHVDYRSPKVKPRIRLRRVDINRVVEARKL